MTLNNQLLKEYRADLEKALKVLNEKHGIITKVGAMTYSDTEFSYSTKAEVGGSKEEIEQRAFDRDRCRFFNFSCEYGTKLTINGDAFKLVGLKPRATKMPIVIQNIATGKKYKVSMETLTNNIK